MDSKRMIDLFCELVKIPSESPNDKEFIAYMEKLLKTEGAKTVKDSFGNLIATFPAKNSTCTEYLAFGCHADTVKPGVNIEPVIEGGVIKSKGDTILGADDKAGIAVVVEMLRSAKKHPPIEFIITRCEEIGTEGSSKLDYSLIQSKMAYVLDEETIDEVIVGAPTKFAFYVEYKGESAHASEPENGVSAVVPAAKAIANLKLGRLADGSTANVGVFEGGEVVNGIPSSAKIIAECRSVNNERAIEIAEEMEQIFRKAAKDHNVKIELNKEIKYYSFLLPENSKVVQVAIDALAKNGIKAKKMVITGGLDANNFNRHGIETATLGVGYREIHTKNEYLIISEMEAVAKTAIDIVEILA